MNQLSWRGYAYEFFTIFIAVIAAFALNNWNENRRDDEAEEKILTEIYHGLAKDLTDVEINILGHKTGIQSCKYWRNVIDNKPVSQDSVGIQFLRLTRDLTAIQNTSGYESLKSTGLKLIENDSLRESIVSLYEFDYQSLQKLEEQYFELQFQHNYFAPINDYLAPYFIFSKTGGLAGLNTPIRLSEAEKNKLLSYLWKIEVNRRFILSSYSGVQNKIENLRERIKTELRL